MVFLLGFKMFFHPYARMFGIDFLLKVLQIDMQIAPGCFYVGMT